MEPNGVSKRVIRIWEDAATGRWRCSACTYMGNTKEAAKKHGPREHGPCTVTTKSIGAKPRKKQVDYWELGGERWLCTACDTVILGRDHMPRNHITDHHDASPHIIRIAARLDASDKPPRQGHPDTQQTRRTNAEIGPTSSGPGASSSRKLWSDADAPLSESISSLRIGQRTPQAGGTSSRRRIVRTSGDGYAALPHTSQSTERGLMQSPAVKRKRTICCQTPDLNMGRHGVVGREASDTATQKAAAPFTPGSGAVELGGMIASGAPPPSSNLGVSQEAGPEQRWRLRHVPVVYAMSCSVEPGTNQVEPGEPVMCTCSITKVHDSTHSELELLGFQRDNAEATRKAYGLPLSFLKVTQKIFLTFGMQKRAPFDLSKPNQRITIRVDSLDTPKLGASATAAAFLAMFAMFFNCSMRTDTVVTGRFTLNGELASVGGVNEKIIGAKSAGFRRMVIPEVCLADLDEDCLEDSEIEVITARNAFQLLELFLDGSLVEHLLDKPEEWEVAMDQFACQLDTAVPSIYMLLGGGACSVISACAYPGTGQEIITGMEPSDIGHGSESETPVRVREDPAESAVRGALRWLAQVEEMDWMRRLPLGKEHLNLSNMSLTLSNSEKQCLQKADLHVDIRDCGPGGASCGAATGIPGYVAAAGEVDDMGNLRCVRAPTHITYKDVPVYMHAVGKGMGNGGPTVPEGVTVKGFRYMGEMLSYALGTEEEGAVGTERAET